MKGNPDFNKVDVKLDMDDLDILDVDLKMDKVDLAIEEVDSNRRRVSTGGEKNQCQGGRQRTW